MIKVKVLKNESYSDESQLPRKGTDFSTGYDVVAMSNPRVVGEKPDGQSQKLWKRIDYIEYDTNLFIAPVSRTSDSYDFDVFDTLVFPRSSVTNKNLILKNCIGLIDNDYRNSIKVRFAYQIQPEDLYVDMDRKVFCEINNDRIYKKGEKICQLKFTQAINAEFVMVDELPSTGRDKGGFGSTGA